MGTLTLSGAAAFKAGANRSTAITEAQWNSYIGQAEGLINAATRVNWNDIYGILDGDKKLILEETASNLVAIYVITYDMSGYTSRAEAESMITVLRDAALRGISILKDIKTQTFIQ